MDLDWNIIGSRIKQSREIMKNVKVMSTLQD